MSTNQRAAFRIDEELDAILHIHGRTHPCRIVNLSAGGARLHSQVELREGRACMVTIPLDAQLAEAVGEPVATMHVEILDSQHAGTEHIARARSIDDTGSPEQQAMARLVFALQRRARSHESGADEASPMQTTAESIRRERATPKLRVSRALWRRSGRRNSGE